MAVPAAILSMLVKVDGVAKATADLYGLNASAKKASMGADDMAAKHAKGSQVIQTAAKVGVVAVGGLAAASVKAASDYESSMNTLQAVSDATGKEMKELGALALKLGADTKLPGTSAQDAAEAMTEMIKAGVSMKDTMGGVRSTLVLSAAAQISNAEAAEIASNALNTFRLRGRDVTMVADQLANTANASSVEIRDVADATKMAGAVFSAFQGPVRGAKGAMTDLNVAIGILGNAGIKGSDAGTSLKQALLQLTGPSDKAKAAMQGLYAAAVDNSTSQSKLSEIIQGSKKVREAALGSLMKTNDELRKGGDIAYDASGRMRSLKDIMTLVTRGTRDMTQEQKNAYLTQIFGADATRAVIALMQAGPKEWDKMTAAVTKQGAAQELAAAKMKGFKGSVEAFKSTMETLAITFGTVLLPAVTSIMRSFASFAGKLGEHKTLVLVLTGVIGGLSVAIVTINAVTKAWAATTAAATAVQTAFNASFLTNPIFLTIAALVALGAALVVAYKKSETFREVIDGVWQFLRGVADWLITAGSDAFRWLATAVTDAWRAIKNITDVVWGPLRDYLAFVWNGWRSLASTVFPAIADVVRVAWNVIRAVTTTAWDAISGIVSTAFGVIKTIITTEVNLYRTIIGGAWEAIKAVTSAAWTAIKNLIVDPVEAAVSAVRRALGQDGLIGWLVGAWDRMRDAVEGLAKPFKTAFAGMGDAVKPIKDLIKDVVDGVKDAVEWLGKIKIPKIDLPDLNPLGGEGNGLTVGPLPTGGGGVDMFKALSLSMGLSGGLGQGQALRPGDDGWHGQNRARDHSGPPAAMLKFAKVLLGFAPKLLELIYTPLGVGVKNGQVVPISFFGEDVMRDHFDHVHVAMEKGGHVKRAGWALVGEKGPELAHLPTGATVYSNRESRAMGGGSGGPLVNIENAQFGSQIEANSFAERLAFRIATQG